MAERLNVKDRFADHAVSLIERDSETLGSDTVKAGLGVWVARRLTVAFKPARASAQRSPWPRLMSDLRRETVLPTPPAASHATACAPHPVPVALVGECSIP
jgi:hypothetical protein